MPDALDPAYLPLIDRALSGAGWMARMPGDLLAAFDAERDLARRANNRSVLLLLTLLFDLFWLPQWQTAPDILRPSGLLRFALFSPCVVLFCLLDWRGRLGRRYDLALLALAVAPCVITAYLCLITMEMLAQPEIYGTPLILLFTCLLLRMKLPMAVANAAICTAFYVGSILVCPMLQHSQISTVIFIQVVIAAASVMFNVQLEARDRRVFLLTQNERIRRALVAEQNRGLLRETQTDALTNLANRRCFDETLSIRWLEALQCGGSLSLVMIDVDEFKQYNDHYGHVMGDSCLRQVAAALAGAARKVDLLARYGGEEFAMIISGGDEENAVAIAERLRSTVAQMRLPHGGAAGRHDAVVTVSLGVATGRPQGPHGTRKLIEQADNSLYEAKRAGRNRTSAGSVETVRLASA